jgi:hypothetical protein
MFAVTEQWEYPVAAGIVKDSLLIGGLATLL